MNKTTKYMTSTLSYPIADSENEILPLLRIAFTKAVVLRAPIFQLGAADISVEQDDTLAAKYRTDAMNPNLLQIAGQTTYWGNLNTAAVAAEARHAKITLSPRVLSTFTERCNRLRDIFSHVFSTYTGIQESPSLRGWPLFTPVGGQGRSPELHVDNTILTLHWSAALSTLKICDTELAESTWSNLNNTPQLKNSPLHDNRTRLKDKLTRLAQRLPLQDNNIGDVLITKGQLGRNLMDADNRQAVCVHASSPSITANGQIAFLMTPKMPERWSAPALSPMVKQVIPSL